MPSGFNKESNKEEVGFVNLKYIDFFDFLPKEDIELFKKRINDYAKKNKAARFSFSRDKEESDNRIDQMGRYIDKYAFSKLLSVSFSHNKYLEKNTYQMTISIHNLSASFIAIKYRIYLSNSYNNELNIIYNNKYHPSSCVNQPMGGSWFKPWKYSKSYYSSNNARQKAVYLKLAEIKWEIYKELEHSFNLYFADSKMFPPTFATYETNIPPSSGKESIDFWNSIGLDYYPDYSQPLNLCVGWDRETSENEGLKLSAFCGGNYTSSGYSPKIAEHEISDYYIIYMVAATITKIAEKGLALCNKKISKAIQSGKSFRILKVRSSVEIKLYYCYRFLNEFTGDSIRKKDLSSFYNELYDKGSLTERSISNIASYVNEIKERIDNLLKILNNSAEFESTKTNLSFQRLIIILTILSIIIAVTAFFKDKINLSDIIDSIIKFFKNLF